jgi:hypothetical protein
LRSCPYEKGDLEKAAFFAKDAAPYCHPRLATIEHGGMQDKPVVIRVVTGVPRSKDSLIPRSVDDEDDIVPVNGHAQSLSD